MGLANLLNNDFLGKEGTAEFKAVCWNETIEPAADNSETMEIDLKRDDVAAVSGPVFGIVPASNWRANVLAFQDEQKAQEEDANVAAEAAAKAPKAGETPKAPAKPKMTHMHNLRSNMTKNMFLEHFVMGYLVFDPF